MLSDATMQRILCGYVFTGCVIFSGSKQTAKIKKIPLFLIGNIAILILLIHDSTKYYRFLKDARGKINKAYGDLEKFLATDNNYFTNNQLTETVTLNTSSGEKNENTVRNHIAREIDFFYCGIEYEHPEKIENSWYFCSDFQKGQRHYSYLPRALRNEDDEDENNHERGEESMLEANKDEESVESICKEVLSKAKNRHDGYMDILNKKSPRLTLKLCVTSTGFVAGVVASVYGLIKK